MRTLLLVCLFAAMGLAQRGGALSSPLGTLTAVGNGAKLDLRVPASVHSVATVVTGTPATCTLRLEGSLDGTTFFDLSGAQVCTTTFIFYVTGKPVAVVRVVVATLTGGSSPSLAVTYLGTP